MIRRKHNYLLDVLLLGMLAGFVLWFFFRIKNSLGYSWNWQAVPQFFFRVHEGRLSPGVLTEGFLTTVRLSLWVVLLSLAIGTAAGIMGSGKSLFFRMIVRTYVEFARNTPPLVLVFIFYFFIGSQIMGFLGVDEWARNSPRQVKILIGVLFSPPARFSEFLSAVLTLSLYEGAYITEIVRGGLLAIPKGQYEAAYVLGLSEKDTYLFVILPQVFKNILPSLAGQAISVIKDSSIVSVISIQELTFQGMELMASTYLIFEVWITVTGLYFVLTFSLSRLSGRLENRLRR